MGSEYVYKSVYDVEQRRMEERMEHLIELNNIRNNSSMVGIDTLLSNILGELKAMNTGISRACWTVTFAVLLVGVFLAVLIIKK